MDGYMSMNRDGTSPPSPIRRQDPFYVLKEKVQVNVAALARNYDRWKDLLENTSTFNNSDFDEIFKSVKIECSSTKIDLNDLQQTIYIVQENRKRFGHITENELNTRQKFINDMQTIIEDMEETMVSERTSKKIESDRQQYDKRKTKETLFSRQVNRDNERYVETIHNEQKGLQNKQDQVLDDMSSILTRLQEKGRTIDVELNEHRLILGEMDGSMDEASSRMKVVIEKTEKLLGKSNRGKYICILMEVMTIIILILLITYT